jgi:multidrug efflux pump subunit AcrA (membrane-fusion protein)
MTPIEAQAMDMSSMPPPVGRVAVTLAPVERGAIAATIRYSGTVLGYAEQAITPRTPGWITWMPYYAGDRVRRGQLLARLDTRELDERVAQQEAARRMADHVAGSSRLEYQQSLAVASRARAEVMRAQGSLEEARQARGRAEAALKQSRQQAREVEQELGEAKESSAAAAAELAEAEAELAAAQSLLPDAQAQQAAAEADQTFAEAEAERSERLLCEGVVATSQAQRARAAARAAVARTSQAGARIQAVRAQIRAAEAKIRKAAALEKAAAARVSQRTSRIDASQAGIEQAQAEVGAAAGRIQQAEAALAGARANATAEQAASQAALFHWQHSREGIGAAEAGLTAARVVKGYTEIRSLVDGVITQRSLSPGTLVAPGQAILTVAQIQPVRVQANVPEADLARVRKGNRVVVSGSGFSPMTAAVTAVFPAVDPTARTGLVEALIPNRDGRLHPGQYITLTVTTHEQRNLLRVPTTAVVWRAGPSPFGQTGEQQASVWVGERGEPAGVHTYSCPMHPEVRQERPGLCPKCKMDLVPDSTGGRWRARRVAVTVGISDGRVVAIPSGLSAGQQVVTSGLQELRDGDALEPAPAVPAGGAGSAGGPASPGGAVSRYWCPMHPEVGSNDPAAVCAKCGGMKLLPRKTDE